MTIKDTDIQIGDIRVCNYDYHGLNRGDHVEIIKPHEMKNFWHLRIVKTGEMWVIENSPEDSALHEDLLKELISRVSDTYEICD